MTNRLRQFVRVSIFAIAAIGFSAFANIVILDLRVTEARAALRSYGVYVTRSKGSVSITRTLTNDQTAQVVSIVNSIAGGDSVTYVYPAEADDEIVPILMGLKLLRLISLDGPHVTNKSIQTLSIYENLEGLSLVGTSVTDSCLDSIAAMPGLVTVDVTATKVTREGVERLRRARPQLYVGFVNIAAETKS